MASASWRVLHVLRSCSRVVHAGFFMGPRAVNIPSCVWTLPLMSAVSSKRRLCSIRRKVSDRRFCIHLQWLIFAPFIMLAEMCNALNVFKQKKIKAMTMRLYSLLCQKLKILFFILLFCLWLKLSGASTENKPFNNIPHLHFPLFPIPGNGEGCFKWIQEIW